MAASSYNIVLDSTRTPDPRPQPQGDEEIVAGLRDSNHNVWQWAANEWFNRDRIKLEKYVFHQARVRKGFGYASSIVDEIVQESFFRAVQKISKEKKEETTRGHNLSALLKGIADNILREYTRYETRLDPLTKIDVDGQEIELPLMDETQDMETIFEKKEEYENIQAALERIESQERDLIERIFLQQESRTEVSKSLEISLGNLRIKLFRALKEVRRQFPEEIEPGRDKRKR